MIFNDFVGRDFLPQEKQLLVIKHPGIPMNIRSGFPYESNKLSTSFISENLGRYYFMGSLNGGDSIEFNKMISTLKKNIDIDLSKNIISIWHDESHLNHYMLDANYKILPDDFVFIEHNYFGKIPKIIIRDKNGFGGHNHLRNVNQNIYTKVKYYIKLVLRKMYHLWK
jgi:hypothetical protein